MNKPRLNLTVAASGWRKDLPAAETIGTDVFALVAARLKDRLQTELPLSANLQLADDAAVQILNKEFRGLDKPTNILSFAHLDDPDFAPLPDDQTFDLGDMIMALETLRREALIQNISLHDHFCHLLVHGLLHLYGFDHQTDAEAQIMEQLEIDILRQMNIKNPYEE